MKWWHTAIWIWLGINFVSIFSRGGVLWLEEHAVEAKQRWLRIVCSIITWVVFLPMVLFAIVYAFIADRRGASKKRSQKK